MIGLFTIGMIGTGMAQEATQPQKMERKKGTVPSPEKVADNQAAKAQQKLGLTDDQKAKYRALTLTRITNVRPLREQAKATEDKEQKKELRAQAKVHYKTFDEGVRAILTPEQITKWDAHKAEMKAKHKTRKDGKPAPEQIDAPIDVED